MPLHESTEDSRGHYHLQQPLEQAGNHHFPPVEEPCIDLRELYSFSKDSDDSGSIRSVSSRTTSRSVATRHVSNTSRSKQKKRQDKRRFRKFAKWLMKFLEKKDPRVFEKAQAVIRDCEQRKARGELGYESVTDSLKEPLREAVGNKYWREARFHLDNFLLDKSPASTELSSSSSESDHQTLSTSAQSLSFASMSSPAPREPLHRAPPSSIRIEPSPLTTQSVWDLGKEKKIRRERFYMILRVLMKYLETRNRPLYSRTKETIHECVARSDESYGSLLESIKRKVKQIVGDSNWRRAESFLSKAILRKARLDAIEEARSNYEQEMIEDSRLLAAVDPSLHQYDMVHENNMIAVKQGIDNEEEPEGSIQEFFANACHTFSSSVKRTAQEHATSCFKGAAAQADSGSICFDHKRRRLQHPQHVDWQRRI